MSQTKSGGKTVGHSEKFLYQSKNFATIAKIYHRENFAMCAKFSLCLIAIFFFEK